MKESTTTRFEVGMSAMLIDNGEWVAVVVDSIHIEEAIIFAKSINNSKFCFNLQGFGYIADTACLIAFTVPEYEALKKLTDSFADGTFGKEQNGYLAAAEATKKVAELFRKPKFEPQLGELIISKNSDTIFKVIHITDNNRYFGKAIEGDYYFENESLDNFKPAANYPYQNGFCIPLKDNPIVSTNPIETFKGGETEIPAPIIGEWSETTDLLDEQGKPVYFSEGMEVGCIALGRVGKVVRILANSNVPVKVSFSDMEYDFYNYTIEGRLSSGFVPVLYPIEQYNTIQLPKLKPIQVAKPKSDVISLPSWFKGVIYLDTDAVIAYLIGFLIGKEKEFNRCLDKANISLKGCKFMSCLVQRIGDYENALCIDFIHDNKAYTLTIDIAQPENIDVAFTVQYNKNGKDIREIL